MHSIDYSTNIRPNVLKCSPYLFESFHSRAAGNTAPVTQLIGACESRSSVRIEFSPRPSLRFSLFHSNWMPADICAIHESQLIGNRLLKYRRNQRTLRRPHDSNAQFDAGSPPDFLIVCAFVLILRLKILDDLCCESGGFPPLILKHPYQPPDNLFDRYLKWVSRFISSALFS